MIGTNIQLFLQVGKQIHYMSIHHTHFKAFYSVMFLNIAFHNGLWERAAAASYVTHTNSWRGPSIYLIDGVGCRRHPHGSEGFGKRGIPGKWNYCYSFYFYPKNMGYPRITQNVTHDAGRPS